MRNFFLLIPCFLTPLLTAADLTQPLTPPTVVAAERDGVVMVEAEHFHRQTLADKRAWHITSAKGVPKVEPDGDPAHLEGASGGAYVELLPDTRRSHGDKLVQGENFTNEGGKMAVLAYKISVAQPGRYYVWVRAYSTTSEDNGLHFGLNGQWPASGARWQTVKKNGWHWDCKQRTEQVHTGVPMQLWLDLATPGQHELLMSMREDGIEVDQIALARDVKWRPPGYQEQTAAAAGTAATAAPEGVVKDGVLTINASSFLADAKGYYLDKGKWLALNPAQTKTGQAQAAFPFPAGRYDVTLAAVGEEDGQSTYQVTLNGQAVGSFTAPLSAQQFEEGPKFATTWKNITLKPGDTVSLASQIASKDGKEFSRARIARVEFAPADDATKAAVAKLAAAKPAHAATAKSTAAPLVLPRKPDGKGAVALTGELKQWHKVTLTLDGPFAHERDTQPNPFTDVGFNVTFTHESGAPKYTVPGYFAADGNAGNSSADAGTKWRAHLSPDKTGKWNYAIAFRRGAKAALEGGGQPVAPFDGVKGSFTVAPTDKTGSDFRAHGRLTYVGKHHLQFAGSKQYFLKAGPDSPETMLAYADFDATVALKENVPLKTWQPHLRDWRAGDPTWRDGKGKGLVGALNYLAAKGVNAFSFLTYNAAGDGDNVWPFIERDAKLHYDCSKLDQWGVVFDHATKLGLYLHFKLQENESDDERLGMGRKEEKLPEALDGGKLGIERKLYCREVIARFGHALALNWNIGEENTQTADEVRDMVKFLHDTDPYRHNIVLHTFPPEQELVYRPLLGTKSLLTGVSIQNSWAAVHQRTLQWLRESAQAGRPWVVANDEQNSASLGVPPDPGYQGFSGQAVQQANPNAKKKGAVENAPSDKATPTKPYDLHDIRKLTLWGNLMAGGAGVEYYFGYQLLENDLVCQDFRSRDKSWDYCRIALGFFRTEKIPFAEMTSSNALIGNTKDDNSKFCFAQPGKVYLVYLPSGGTSELDLSAAKGSFTVRWFNPRTGGALRDGSVKSVAAGGKVALGNPPAEAAEDWLAVVRP